MFKVEFSIDNAAFQDGFGREETARILRKIAEQVKNGSNSSKISDINGNVIGAWKVNK
jgi:hypothetical protein